MSFLKVKTYEEHSDNGKQKEKYDLHRRAQLGSNWRWLEGNDGHLKYLLWLTVDWGHPVFIQFYYLLPQPLPLWNKWRVQKQTRLTNTIYKLSFFQQFCFKVSSLYKRHTTYNTIYRAFKLTNSYLQIYLVKPWLISTVFNPTLQLFKDKTLEYLKILNSKKQQKRKRKNLLISFFDPKTLFSER